MASIFPANTVTTFTDTITTTISDNMGMIIGVVAVIFGINFARRMLNRGLKGKVEHDCPPQEATE